MAKTLRKTFEVVEVVAAAMTAYRINDGIVKTFDPEKPEATPNKTMIIGHFVGDQPIDITDEDRTAAEAAIQTIQSQQLLMQLKGKDVNQFTNDIIRRLDRQVTSADFGLLVYVPNVLTSIAKFNTNQEVVSAIAYTSRALGNIGQKVKLSMTVLTARYSQEFGFYSVFGHDGSGNLVSYLTKHQHLTTSQDITGKIRVTGIDPYHNAFVNQLNFVKPVKASEC